MKIAVVSTNIRNTIEWLKQKVKIKEVSMSRRLAVDYLDNEYIIVSTFEHAAGMEFQDIMISPDYYTLEEYVRTRVRK